jgi:polyhydroxybutyrate depolymerase
VRNVLRIVAATFMLVVGACGLTRCKSASPTDTASLHPGTTKHTISWDGQQRTYLLHVPSALPVGSHPPLVVALHGATVTAAETERYYHWDDLADAKGVVVAYPQGINNAWNAGSCCSDAPSRNTDDLGFVGAVLGDASTRVAADPSRRYMTGVSNGAMMTLRYACERPGELAAIGSVAGTFTSRCDHPPPIPFIAIHGLNDRAVSFEASSNTAETGPDIRLPGVETIGRFFVADGCRDPMTTTAGPVHTQTGTCAPGLDVKVMTIEGAGHQWPGATIDADRLAADGPQNEPSRALDATAELWTFFSTHVLRQAG